MKIYVTGIGTVNAAGLNIEESLNSLLDLKTGIRQDGSLFLGKVHLTDQELKIRSGIDPDEKIPRTSLIGLLAAQEAFQPVSVAKDDLRTGFINGLTTGGMDLVEKYFSQVYKKVPDSDPNVIKTHDLGSVTSLIAGKLGIESYVNSISTACTSSANSIMMGARMLRADLLDRVLVGGCDALTSFTLAGFSSLMIHDPNVCQPFNENRNGMNLGEGAGYLLLENERSVEKSGNKILAELNGWFNANDAFHQTASSPDGTGAFLAMNGALKSAKIQADEINYLNAHGTGTRNNDVSELAAIERTFENVQFSTTKGYTGHTLGASGGIEAVFSVLSIREQVAFPVITFMQPMKESRLYPLSEIKSTTINHVMTNSLGFGGNATSLVFSAI